MATPLGCGKAASVVPSVFECRLSQADVVAVPLVNKYKGDVAPAAAMNYNASAATTRDADRIGGKGEATVTVKVEAGSSLLQVVEQSRGATRIAGTLQANGAGSTGGRRQMRQRQ
jgi:hypothetical protein